MDRYEINTLFVSVYISINLQVKLGMKATADKNNLGDSCNPLHSILRSSGSHWVIHYTIKQTRQL